MSEMEDFLSKRPLRGVAGRRPLVVRQEENGFQLEVLERLERLEALSEPTRDNSTTTGERNVPKVDLKVLVAMGAIALSVTGYVIEDARNSSRQDSEIEATEVRVSNLEKIAASNTEARIRNEVELGELHEGQAEIKHMLQQHEEESHARRQAQQ